MEEILATIEAMPVAQYLRTSRWGYAAVNTAHVLGIALLVGAILPLNLRLLGFWRSVPRAALARVLVPVAATGLLLAVVAGALLFSVRPGEYAALGVLRVKVALIALGILGALALHRAYGLVLEQASDARVAGHAILSTVCWLGALICGRLIAFVMD
ncbi:MAG TPA: DUF2214 domain-containing protein [Hyphomicrobium sp.]